VEEDLKITILRNRLNDYALLSSAKEVPLRTAFFCEGSAIVERLGTAGFTRFVC